MNQRRCWTTAMRRVATSFVYVSMVLAPRYVARKLQLRRPGRLSLTIPRCWTSYGNALVPNTTPDATHS